MLRTAVRNYDWTAEACGIVLALRQLRRVLWVLKICVSTSKGLYAGTITPTVYVCFAPKVVCLVLPHACKLCNAYQRQILRPGMQMEQPAALHSDRATHAVLLRQAAAVISPHAEASGPQRYIMLGQQPCAVSDLLVSHSSTNASGASVPCGALHPPAACWCWCNQSLYIM